MLSIFVVSKLIGLKSYSLNVVSIAGICLLLLNPYNYFDLGYMLSISVVLSIVWLIQDIKKVHKIWIINALGNINLVNYAAFWGSFIIIAQNFQSIIPVSLVSNMVLIPMVAFIMPLSFILLLILQIPQLNFFTFVFEWLISKLLYLCNLFSNFSWSTFHFDSKTQLLHDKEHFVIVFLIISFGIVHNKKVTIFFIWQEEDETCRENLLKISEVFKIYRKRGLSLITICISQDKEKTLEALKQAQISGYNFTSTFYQVSSVFNLSGLDGRATPCVVIINNKGAVETRFNGMPEIDVLKTKVINILNN